MKVAQSDKKHHTEQATICATLQNQESYPKRRQTLSTT